MDIDFDTLWNRDLLPYRHLIERDLLPSIMLAHTIYPAVDPDLIATVSKKVVTGLLRDKMGYNGVITTDSMTMGAVATRYGVPEACAMSLAAGSDLLLMKAQNDLVGETFRTIKSYVLDGKISEADLDQKITRIFSLKQHLGLFDVEAPRESPDDLVTDIRIKETEREIAEKCCMVLQQAPGVLPLATDKRFLLVEQVSTERANRWQFPGMMFKEATDFNRFTAFLEVGFSFDAEDKQRIRDLVPEYDTVVFTNFHDRADAENTPFLNEIMAASPEKTFVLITNKPFPMAIPDHAENVICTFGKTPQSIRAAVRILFGDLEPQGTLPLESENPALQEA